MVLLHNLGLTGTAAKFFTLVSICVFTFWEIQPIPNQFCWISVVLEMSLATLCMDLMFGKMKTTDYVIVSFPNTTFVPITQSWLVSFFWLTSLWLILKVCQSHGTGQFAFKLKMHQTKKASASEKSAVSWIWWIHGVALLCWCCLRQKPNKVKHKTWQWRLVTTFSD